MTLQEYFNANPKGALALSGGVDSAYLLHCAQAAGAQAFGREVVAVQRIHEHSPFG